jgi:formylglycine-generating enzyme required for sulfatase activity
VTAKAKLTFVIAKKTRQLGFALSDAEGSKEYAESASLKNFKKKDPLLARTLSFSGKLAKLPSWYIDLLAALALARLDVAEATKLGFTVGEGALLLHELSNLEPFETYRGAEGDEERLMGLRKHIRNNFSEKHGDESRPVVAISSSGKPWKIGLDPDLLDVECAAEVLPVLVERLRGLLAPAKPEEVAKRAELGAVEQAIADLRRLALAKGVLDAALAPLLAQQAALRSELGLDTSESPGTALVFQPPAEVSPSDNPLLAYCEKLIDDCGHIPLQGVAVGASDPTGRPERMELAAIYVDLDTRTSVRERVRKLRRPADVAMFEDDEVESSRPLRVLEAVASTRRAVLLGDPGSGKSTFLSYVALCLAAHRLHPEEGWLKHLSGWKRAEELLPIPVILRDFARSLPAGEPVTPDLLWSFIVDRLRRYRLGAAEALLEAALQEGRALVLLDGLDEIPSNADRVRVRDAVTAFANRYKKSDFLITCRTLSYRDPAWRVPDAKPFELAPFDSGKIKAFIGHWYTELARRGAVEIGEAKASASRLQKAVRRPDLRNLAPNPLLLTVMALVHAHRGRLPEARALLYEEIIDLLLWRWENQRTKRLSKLLDEASLKEIDLKCALFRLAFEAHGATSGGGDEKLADLAERDLEKALSALRGGKHRDWAGEIIEAMKLRAGLLLERVPEIYTFPHRTFQEYLAGAHLSIQGDFPLRAARLAREGPLWREVVLLAVGRLVHLIGDTDKPVALLGELCPERAKETPEAWTDVWTAGDVLAEIGIPRIEAKGSQHALDLAERVQARLVELVERGKLDPRARARAGDALGRAGDPRFRAREEWCLPAGDKLGFMEIPGGIFLMGSDKKKDPRAYDDELPQHPLKLPLYYMARYPVTEAQYRVFAEENGQEIEETAWARGKPNHPVVYVSWEDAWAYADWLTDKLLEWPATPAWLLRLLKGEGGKCQQWRVVLPSEAEWEKAARGADGRIYPWKGEADPDKANYNETRIGGTSAVGCFAAGASPYGCEEMSGNMWEWTRNLWREGIDESKGYPYDAGDGREIRKASFGSLRVVRGGSFDDDGRNVRCAVRCRDRDGRDDYIGFRVAVSPYTSVL